jgi:hypothetical protein
MPEQPAEAVTRDNEIEDSAQREVYPRPGLSEGANNGKTDRKPQETGVECFTILTFGLIAFGFMLFSTDGLTPSCATGC